MPYIGAQPDKGNFSDLNGAKLIIDADADTSITADTDDQIDIEIAGADDFRFTANTFTVLSGSTLTIASGATIANSGTATGFSSADPSSADGDSLGTASAEWSDLYLADGGVIYFGNDQDVTVTHDPDDGLFLKSAATGDDNPFLLTLQTGETDLAADDVLGKISFQAPDEATGTDAILVSAAIQARSEQDFSASVNKTSIDFMVGASEVAATKMTLNSSGQLLIGDGTVSLPSYTNTGDLDTGVYFPAADDVGIVCGGTEVFRFGSNMMHGSSKNLLMNGHANVAQRGTSVSGLGASNYVYGLDGWCHYAGYGSAIRYTMAQDSGPGVGFDAISGNSLKIDITTADTDSTTANLFSGFIQKIEGQFLQHLRAGHASGAKPMTLSFWTKGTKTGTHSVALYAQDGNRTCPMEWTMASSDTWQKVSVTFPGDSGATSPPDDNTPYLWVVFPLHSGSTYEGTSGSWQAGEKYATSSTVNIGDSTSNDFYVTDVQLEVGDVATDFAHERFDVALARCQRYLQVWGDPKDGAGDAALTGVCRSTTSAQINFGMFNVEMRSAPTMTWSTVNCIDSSASGVNGTITTGQAGRQGLTASVSGTGFTDGNGIVCELKASSSFIASSEL